MAIFKSIYNKTNKIALNATINYAKKMLKKGGQIAYNSQIHKVIHDLDLALHE